MIELCTSELHMRTFTLNGLVQHLPIDGTDKRLSPINGFTNARSLAKIYASLLFNENILTKETLTKSIMNNTPHNEPDLVLNSLETKFSQGGYMLDETVIKDFGKAFGHWGKEEQFIHFDNNTLNFFYLGLGGSIAFASIDKQLSFAYIPNKLTYDVSKTDFRVQRILDGVQTLID